jgi:hypothetical protein
MDGSCDTIYDTNRVSLLDRHAGSPLETGVRQADGERPGWLPRPGGAVSAGGWWVSNDSQEGSAVCAGRARDSSPGTRTTRAVGLPCGEPTSRSLPLVLIATRMVSGEGAPAPGRMPRCRCWWLVVPVSSLLRNHSTLRFGWLSPCCTLASRLSSRSAWKAPRTRAGPSRSSARSGGRGARPVL